MTGLMNITADKESEKSMIKLAIFDLDGTLANSIYDLAAAVDFSLKEHGYAAHTVEEYRQFVGNGARKLIERAAPKGTDGETLDELHRGFSVYYREHCLDKTKPYDGITEVIKKLRAEGIKCAVASNKPDEFSQEIVTALFGSEGFDLVRGKLDGVPTKPQPDILFGIAEKLGIGIGDAVMIGDSNVDVQTAHNAGIKCIGCEWGFRGKDELVTAGADMLAQCPDDIYRLLHS